MNFNMKLRRKSIIDHKNRALNGAQVSSAPSMKRSSSFFQENHRQISTPRPVRRTSSLSSLGKDLIYTPRQTPVIKRTSSLSSFGKDLIISNNVVKTQESSPKSIRPKRKIHGMKKNLNTVFAGGFHPLRRNSMQTKNKYMPITPTIQRRHSMPVKKKPDCCLEGEAIRNFTTHMRHDSHENDEETTHHDKEEIYCHQNCSIADSLRKIERDRKDLELVRGILIHQNTEHIIVESIFDTKNRKRGYLVSWQCKGSFHSGPTFHSNLHVSVCGKKDVRYNRSKEICVSRFHSHLQPILDEHFRVADTQEVFHSLMPGHDLGGKIVREIYFVKGAAQFRFIMNHNLSHKLKTLTAFRM